MAGRHKWSELRDKLMADPERRARVEIIKRAMIDGDRLARIRQERAGTQQALAEQIELSQARISQIESGQDLYLSTLRAYIEALGGHLEIAAVFPDARIDLTPAGATE